MRLEELDPNIDIERIADDVLTSMLRWSQPIRNPAFLAAMYGDELEELEVEAARRKLDKIDAQILKIRASAAADITKARHKR